jgi:hypothetical protein
MDANTGPEDDFTPVSCADQEQIVSVEETIVKTVNSGVNFKPCDEISLCSLSSVTPRPAGGIKRHLSPSEHDISGSEVKKSRGASESDSDTSLSDIIILPGEQETEETELKKISRKNTRARRNLQANGDKGCQPLNKSKLKSCKTKELKPKGLRGTKGNNKNKTSNIEDTSSNVNVSIPVDTDFNQDLIDVLKQFADEMTNVSVSMEKLRCDVYEKIDNMADRVENNLTQKFNNILDKRVNTEMKKNRKDTEKQVNDLRDEVNTDIKILQEKVEVLSSKLYSVNMPKDRKLNICVFNHPERENENIYEIVSDLISDGLMLPDVGFQSAERKQRSDSKPGVIIVTCNSAEDRDRMLRNKTGLRNTQKYKTVYVNPDEPLENRINKNNLRVLISNLGVSGLKVSGSRLVENGGNRHHGEQHRDEMLGNNDRAGSVHNGNNGVSRGIQRQAGMFNQGRNPRQGRGNGQGGYNGTYRYERQHRDEKNAFGSSRDYGNSYSRGRVSHESDSGGRDVYYAQHREGSRDKGYNHRHREDRRQRQHFNIDFYDC